MEGEHGDLLRDAIATEGEAQRALLAGDVDRAAEGFAEAVRLYRHAWETAPPGSFGRLIGMLKATVLAGADPAPAAAFVRSQLDGEGTTPPSWYALAIAALVEGDDALAGRAAEGMRQGSPAFERAADAVAAIATSDAPALQSALEAILADFETRQAHLTTVPLADTALMFLRLAERRGLHAALRSPLLPA